MLNRFVAVTVFAQMGAGPHEELRGRREDQGQTEHGVGKGSAGEKDAGHCTLGAEAALVRHVPLSAVVYCHILCMDAYGNASYDEATKSAVYALAAMAHVLLRAINPKPLSFSYDSTKEPNEKEKDERSRTKSRVFAKLLEMLNMEEIEGQKSKKESVKTAVQGLVRLLEKGAANEAEKEAATGGRLMRVWGFVLGRVWGPAHLCPW
jgi:hypothetical protein